MKDQLFSRTNLYLFGLCAALLVIGYVLLGQPGPTGNTAENLLSKSVAPAILVAVYCCLIPYAIVHGYHKKEGGKEAAAKPDKKGSIKSFYESKN